MRYLQIKHYNLGDQWIEKLFYVIVSSAILNIPKLHLGNANVNLIDMFYKLNFIEIQQST